jgi:hypothetical protein
MRIGCPFSRGSPGKKRILPMRLRILLPALMLFCANLSAHADDASKLAKVHEFFEISKADQLSTQVMKQVMDQMNSGMMQQLTGTHLTADQQKQLNEFNKQVQAIMTSSLGWDKLEPEYAKLYVAAYSEQQLDDILAFYKSPTGQAMVEKNPELLKQSSVIAQQHLMSAMPELQKLMKDFAAQATANGDSSKPQ